MSDPLEQHDLGASLPYLLNRAGVHIAAAFIDEVGPRFGVTVPLWRILAALLRQDGQRLTELAEHTSIDVSTVSRLVSGAVRRGLVSRHRAEDDARSVAIGLTEAGRALVLQIVPVAQLYERIALSGFDEQEVAQLKDYLNRVYRNVVSLGPKSAAPRARRAGARTAAGGVPEARTPLAAAPEKAA